MPDLSVSVKYVLLGYRRDGIPGNVLPVFSAIAFYTYGLICNMRVFENAGSFQGDIRQASEQQQ